MRPFAKIFLAFCFLLQPLAAVSQVPLEDALRADVEFLCSPLCEGRAAGTRGGVEAAAYIARRLSGMGYEVAAQSFAIDSTRVGHNILAYAAAGVAPSGVRPSGSPHHPFGTVPPKRGNPGSPKICRFLGCPRGWHVPQGGPIHPLHQL